MSRQVVLALASEQQQAVVCAALTAHGVVATGLPLSAHLETAVMQAMRGPQPPLLLIDIIVLAQLATGTDEFCAWKRSHCANADLLLYCSELHTVPAQARAWAQRLGAHDLLPGCDLVHRRQSLLPTMNSILMLLGAGVANETAMERALLALPTTPDDRTSVAQAWRLHDELHQIGVDPDTLRVKMRGAGGIDIRARRFRTKTYDECFIGHEAVDWLMQNAGAPRPRTEALRIGQALLALGRIYHVGHEQPFLDGHFFYRTHADTPRLSALDLCDVVARLRDGGVRIRDRKFHGVCYPACFVGADAVTWIRNAFELGEHEASTLGQRLMDLYMVHHVTNSQPFRNGHFFYRFYQDEK